MSADRRRGSASAGAAARQDHRSRASRADPTPPARLFGRRARVLAAIEPGVSRVPGFAECPQPDDLPADAARARLLADLRETIAAFTEERPVLLVLDDLQWADALTLQFLLTSRLQFFERNALLVVGTFRTDEQPQLLRDVLACRPSRASISDDSTRRPIGAMVGDMLALADPPRAFVEFVTPQSEGNPFFVAEYLRTAVAERLLQRTERTMGVRRRTIGEGALRAARAAGVAARARGPSARGTSRWRAAGGSNGCGSWPRSRCGGCCSPRRECRKPRRWKRSANLVPGRYSSRSMVAATVSSTTSFARWRTTRSLAIGAEIFTGTRPKAWRPCTGETEEFPRFQGSLAFHYERAGDRPRAIEHLEKASEHASRAFADRDVVNHLTSALRLDDEQGGRIEPQRRAAWRTAVGMALRGLGEFEDGRRQLEQSLGERGYPVPTKSGFSVARHMLRELALRRSLKSPPVAPRRSDPDAERALNAYNFVAMIAYQQSDVPAQLFCTFAALRLAPRVGPSPPAAQLYAAAGNVLGFFGLTGLAWRYAGLSHEIARATGHALSLGVVHQYSGIWPRSLETCATFDADIHQALEVYTRVGHHRFREEALTNCAHLYGLRGELARSLEAFREIERSGLARDDAQTVGWGSLGQARLMGSMGRTNEALRRFDEAVPRVRDDLSQLEGLAARALTLAQLGEHARARDDIASVLRSDGTVLRRRTRASGRTAMR